VDTTALDPMIGQLVDDRYEVTARIARGGMATVYRAVDRRLERTVAVKVMHPHLAESPDFVARFRREARAAARLSHPGVVAVHDQGMAGEASYLTMEYIDGPNLRTVLRGRGPLPLGEALSLVEQVLDALASAHRAGLVHRDIKPENVLLTPEGRAKVADFGLARAVTEATAATTGTVLGTVAYLAPEIVTEGRADPRADVYAVGVLLYELLTGSQPFTGEAPIQVAFQHVNSAVPAPSAAVPWLPAEVDELVAALTARSPEDRPHDAGAALALLRRTVAALDPATLARRAHVPAAPSTAEPADPDATQVTEVRSSGHGTVALPIGAIARQADTTAVAAPRRRRAWPRLLLALLVLLVAAGGGTLWWFQVGPGATVAAPDVVGRTEDEAVAAIKRAQLVPVVDRTHHDTVPQGTVIATDPGAGAQVRKGGDVDVSVSEGILTLEVPEVAGKAQADAEAALKTAGLPRGEVTQEYHDTVPQGTVISSSPAAGEVVPHTTAVNLVVSNGRQPVEPPDVTGSSRDDAAAALQGAGLTVGDVTEQFSDSVAAGRVISQSAGPGTQLFKGDAVSLVVSKGPELFAVPDVVGTQVREARSALEGAGFRVEVNEVLGGFFGTVRAQDPAAGTMLPRGSVITLTVV
jgi:serine/threonine-protein kinase